MTMVKNRIFNPLFLAIILMTMALSSCKDWLSIAPENDLIKEKFWTKREDVDGALAATYNAFRDGAFRSFMYGEIRADIAEFGDQFGDYNRIAASNINPTNGAINWKDYYRTINLANTLMHYDKQVLEKDKTFTQEMKDGVDAEALFLRSISYFYLIRVWKDVPLVLEPSISDTTELFLPKKPEKEVINQIIKDLLIAKDLAYTDQFQDNLAYYKGRANKYSIMALLADVYLWDQQYQKSIDYCDSLINTGKFALESYDTWFNLYNPGNSMSESIFEIQFDDNLESQENPMYESLLFPSQLSFGKILPTILDKEDLRQVGTIGPEHKYMGITYNSPVGRSSAQRDANFIYYRYADILLMKAEAATELNNFQMGNEFLNLTRERAGLSVIDITVKDDLRKAILDERAREFVIEGKRWFDLLRAAKRNHFEKKQIIIDMILAGADIQQQAILRTKVYDTMSYYLPIQEGDLLYNPNLEQNPFYNR
ncbi:MAG TPA: RagB/SusD family nutrient uptake outer membrane protein [Prolixibacteraceae bacterium]|nr:RagB/SusD family nutrient uptake outer membrane protein [Prolixibacteraceae bacterium]